MHYTIEQVQLRTVAGFHRVGPWEKTVKQGFEQLMMWVEGQSIPAKEWVAVYFDNPDEVPPEKLRCNTVVTVADDFTLPPNSEGAILTQIEGGEYAVASARVRDGDFATPWLQFFDALLKDDSCHIDAKPCFECYLNDGNQDGYWDIQMYVAVARNRI